VPRAGKGLRPAHLPPHSCRAAPRAAREPAVRCRGEESRPLPVVAPKPEAARVPTPALQSPLESLEPATRELSKADLPRPRGPAAACQAARGRVPPEPTRWPIVARLVAPAG